MKKNFFSFFAASALLLAAVSCSQDEFENGAEGNNAQVSFSVNFEGGTSAATRTISDGKSVDKLVYAVFDATGTKELIKDTKTNVTYPTTVSVSLAKNQTYQIVFWAQNTDCTAYDTDNLPNVTVSYKNAAANDETRDAFFASVEKTVTGSFTETVTLKRPFAQLNVGVTDDDWKAAVTSGVEIEKSSVIISEVATSLNLLDGTVSGSQQKVEFALAATPKSANETLDVTIDGEKKSYNYLSMNYLLVNNSTDATASSNVDATFTFQPKNGESISLDVFGVTVQRNYRTNIIGRMLTGDAQFNIEIDNEFDGNYVYDNTDNISTKEDLLAALKKAVEAGETNITLDAFGANIGALNSAFTTALVPENVTVTVRNANVSGRSYGNKIDGTLIFENCTFNNATGAYSIHFDGGKGHVAFNKCELIGWNSFGSTITVAMHDCAISGNGIYALVRFYKNSTMTNCTFDGSNTNTTDDYTDGVSMYNGEVLTMSGCTVENGIYEYGKYPKGQTEGGSYILVDGVRLVNDATTLTEALKNGDKILMENDITVEDGINFTTAVSNINIDGGNHKLTAGQIKTQSVGNFVVSNLTLESTGAGYAIYTMGGTVEFTNVTYNGTKGRAICFYGGGNVTLTNCNITGEISSPDDYDCTNIWCGNGRVLTVNGGTYGSIFMNASNSWGGLHASSITLNNGTITKLILETEMNSEKTGYKSATLIHNGGTITTLVENPQDYKLDELEKLN